MEPRLIVRRILRQDVDEVRKLLHTAGSIWSKSELLDFLDDGLSSGLVAEDRELVGALLFRVRCSEMALAVVTLAVAPEYRRRRVGSVLLNALGRNLTAIGTGCIELLVSERDLAAQLFLRANGFRVVRIDRQVVNGDDAYLFQRQYVKALACARRKR
jgi:ribosomal protein S18 acetylase RimI-like enzyme